MAAKKPVFVVLESYVLDAIGQLPSADEKSAASLVHRVLGKGQWRTVIRNQFGLERSVDDQLRSMWEQAKKLAKDKGHELSGREFAQMVVEENFQDVIEMVSTELENKAKR